MLFVGRVHAHFSLASTTTSIDERLIVTDERNLNC